jgi:hypothetical protein
MFGCPTRSCGANGKTDLYAQRGFAFLPWNQNLKPTSLRFKSARDLNCNGDAMAKNFFSFFFYLFKILFF